jgi:hypothetical protein
MSSDATMHDEQNNNKRNKRPIVEIAEIADTEPEEAQQSNKRSAHGETETLWTLRVATTGDTVMSDSETETETDTEANETNETNEANETKRANETNESNEANEAKRAKKANESNEALAGLAGLPGLPGLGGMTMYRPSKHENVVRIAAGTKPAYRAYRPFYVSGLGPGQEKEGLAISAHLDHGAPDSFTWSAEEIAERRAEVREVLGAMLANVDELTARMRAHSGWKENVSRAEVREKLAYMLGATWQSFMGVDFPGSGPGTIQCFSSYYNLVAA